MNTFRFDPEKHEYWLGERRLANVSSVARDFADEPSFATEWHMHRGSMVHRAIALALEGKLNWKTVDERIKGKVDSAMRAVDDLGLTAPCIIERPMFHPLRLFAGTPDLFADLRLVDWKSAHFPLSTPVQVGGYLLLAEINGIKVKEALEIVLADDGYALHPLATSPAEIRRLKGLFNAALTRYQWIGGK